jgi:hypothetical protein
MECGIAVLYIRLSKRRDFCEYQLSYCHILLVGANKVGELLSEQPSYNKKILALIVLAVRLGMTLQRTKKTPAYTGEKIYGLWC